MIIPETLTIAKPDPKLLKIINNKVFNDKTLYEKESTFHNIKVVENEIGRFLHYNDTYQAGIIKTHYYKGNLPYINYFLLPYFYRKSIKSVLLIGLGSGKIVNDLLKLFPEINRFDVVDIEENILEIAQKYFDFNQPKMFNFELQDAIVYLRTTRKKYDLIIVDVANNDGIDERFISKDYLSCIKSKLTNDGIFVSNLCSSAQIEHPKNTFFKMLKRDYKNIFNNVKFYKGNYSDKIYYKAFFNLDERVIDITNLIILASKSELSTNLNKIKDFSPIFPNIDVTSILHDEI